MDTILLFSLDNIKLLRSVEKGLKSWSGKFLTVMIGNGFNSAIKAFNTEDKFGWYRGLSQIVDLELDSTGQVYLFILGEIENSAILSGVWELLRSDYNSMTHTKITPKIKIICLNSTNLPLQADKLTDIIVSVMNSNYDLSTVQIRKIDGVYVLLPKDRHQNFQFVRNAD